MTRYTEGPWRIGEYNEIRADRGCDAECVLIANYVIAPLGLDYGNSITRPLDYSEGNANARLIAAAPELLAVLEKWDVFMRRNYSDEDLTPLWAETEGALARAKVHG